MRILLIAATRFEVSPCLMQYPRQPLLITGVGPVNTTYRLTRHLLEQPADVVVQAGIAGRFEHSPLQLADTCLISHDVLADAGAYEPPYWHSLHDLGLDEQQPWITCHVQPAAHLHLPVVKGATVSTLTTNEAWINSLQLKWKADVESMEGAAAAYICAQMQIPFVQLRSISNTVGQRNKAQWKMQEAIENLNHWLAQLLKIWQ